MKSFSQHSQKQFVEPELQNNVVDLPDAVETQKNKKLKEKKNYLKELFQKVFREKSFLEKRAKVRRCFLFVPTSKLVEVVQKDPDRVCCDLLTKKKVFPLF